MITKKERSISPFFLKWMGSFLTLAISLNIYCQLPDIRVSIKANNRNISQIIDNISLITGYYFTYDAKLIGDKEKMTFIVNNLTLQKTLDSLFRNPLLEYKLIDKNIVIFKKNQVQIPVENLLQKNFQLRGIITDKTSREPLAFATISLFGTNKGTISNLSGVFMLNIPPDLTDPVLVVSYIGYKNQYKPVTLPPEENIQVSLEKDIVSMQEVIIRVKDPLLLLYETIKRIPENYLTEYSRMNGYYREYVKKNKKFLNFYEAVVEIAKEPYNYESPVEKVKVLKARKILNVNVEDTVFMKIKSGIYNCLELDIIKNPPDFLSGEIRKLFDFEFSDIVNYDNQLVYVINFHQNGNIKEALFQGSLYLDQKSLSLLAADFQINPEKIGQDPDRFIVKKNKNIKVTPLLADYHVEYRKTNNKYHLSQVHAEVRFKIRNQNQWIGSNYILMIELAITEVEPGTRVKFRFDEQLKPSVVLSDEPYRNDSAFWGSYDIIEPEAPLQEVLKRLGTVRMESEDNLND